jgi:hypothetical protein
MYAPQRVNTKPTMPPGMNMDPRKMLLEALKKLTDPSTQRLVDQSPAAVMGAVTNPGDIAPGIKAGVLGNLGVRAQMMSGTKR